MKISKNFLIQFCSSYRRSYPALPESKVFFNPGLQWIDFFWLFWSLHACWGICELVLGLILSLLFRNSVFTDSFSAMRSWPCFSQYSSHPFSPKDIDFMPPTTVNFFSGDFMKSLAVRVSGGCKRSRVGIHVGHEILHFQLTANYFWTLTFDYPSIISEYVFEILTCWAVNSQASRKKEKSPLHEQVPWSWQDMGFHIVGASSLTWNHSWPELLGNYLPGRNRSSFGSSEASTATGVCEAKQRGFSTEIGIDRCFPAWAARRLGCPPWQGAVCWGAGFRGLSPGEDWGWLPWRHSEGVRTTQLRGKAGTARGATGHCLHLGMPTHVRTPRWWAPTVGLAVAAVCNPRGVWAGCYKG